MVGDETALMSRWNTIRVGNTEAINKFCIQVIYKIINIGIKIRF